LTPGANVWHLSPLPRDASINPLLDNLRIEPTPGPSVLVIFGASGDLTRRKLLPAIYHLARAQRVPAQFSIIGIARTPLSDDTFRQQFQDSLKEFGGVDAPSRDDVARSLAARLHYISGELD
jgi:glucose-6-phosphate 1-dehydrogenase